MTANLNNLTSENIGLILDIVRIGNEMGVNQQVIDAAINIANAESSLTRNADNPTSTAWGPFQYLDGAWVTGWNRLVRDYEYGDNLTATDTRYNAEWQIRVAINELRIYNDGYPNTIHSAWKDEVQSLVSRGFDPDSNFLQYAYLRHNTDATPGGQVETVYTNHFTNSNVLGGIALGRSGQLIEKALSSNPSFQILDMDVRQDANGHVFVEIAYNDGPNTLQKNGVEPNKIKFYAETGQIIAVYPDSTENGFGFANGNIFDHCFAAGTEILTPSGVKRIEDIRENDIVLAFDPKTDMGRGQLVTARVLRVFEKESSDLHDLAGLKVTSGHMFFSAKGEFKKLADFKKEDAFIGAKGELIPYRSPSKIDGIHKVYNFEVEGLHTYIAGGYRVHNDSLLPTDEVLFYEFDANDNLIIYVENELGYTAKITESRGSNGERILLEREETYISSDGDLSITKTYNSFDANEAPLGEPDIELNSGGQLFQGEVLGNIFGSQLGQILGGSNVLAQIGAATIGSTILGHAFDFTSDVGESLLSNSMPHQASGYTSNLSAALDEAIGELSALDKDLIANLQGQTLTVLSSLLVAEVAEALGIDGFEGQVFTAVGSTLTGQMLTNITANAQNLTVNSLINGIQTWELVHSLGANFGTLLGSHLGSQLVDPDDVGEAFSISVGGAYGGLVLGTAISGGLGHALGVAVGSKATTLLGALILPGVGALIGAVLGQVAGSAVYEFLDDLTGGWLSDLIEPEPFHDVNIGFNSSTNTLFISGDNSDDTTEALREGTYSMTNAYIETVNKVIEMVGGKVNIDGLYNSATGLHDHARFSYVDDDLTYGSSDYQVILGTRTNYVDSNGDYTKIVRMAVEYELSKMVFYDGSLTKIRAFEKWKAELGSQITGNSLDTLMTYLQTAEAYEAYMEDATAINALIASETKSAFAAGWAATLLMAEGLGLNDPYKTGFLDGNTATATWNADKIIAADGSDLIFADAGNDIVKAYGGNDTVNGGDGNDQIWLGNGNDQVWSEAGNDTLYGGNGDDILDGGNGADRIDGGDGKDVATYNGSASAVNARLNGTAGSGGQAQGDVLLNIEELIGSAFNDTLTGSNKADSLHGRAGKDTIYGEAGDDWIVGDAPEHNDTDTLYGEDGNDKLEGGAGNDTLNGGNDNDTVFAGANNDVVYGGLGQDSLYGDDGNDSVSGDDGDDAAWGGNGDDTLIGGAGLDHLYGDYGNDSLSGGTGVDELFGYDGNDTIRGGDDNDLIAGENGNDSISGDNGDDVIYSDGPGYTGLDTVSGGSGHDLIKSGSGNDSVAGDAGNDSIYGEAGDDTLLGGLDHDFIHAGSGNDSVDGGAGDDTLLGYEGHDIITDLSGNNILYGLSGNDVMESGSGTDVLYGDEGNDTMLSGSGNDFLDGWKGTDSLVAGVGNDTIVGGDSNDVIDGGDGNDVIYGDRQPNPDTLPSSHPAILGMIPNNPGFDTFGLVYQGPQYTLAQLIAAPHEMLIINPSKDSVTNIPSSETFWSASEISQIKQAGKMVFGYVNLAKMNTFLNEWDADWTTSGVAFGELTSDAPAWLGKVESATTRLVDFTDSDWHDFVFNRVETMIEQGFHGTLLDDVLEYYFRVPSGLTGTAFEQAVALNAQAMRDFIVEIREFADDKIEQIHGQVTASNQFQLIVNGAPYILKDAIMSDNILSNAQNQAYLDSINMIMVENYFSRDAQLFIDDTITFFGNNGIPMLSIDTDQVTQQQRIQIITDAVNNGFLPYTTENSIYDTLNGTFLNELMESPLAGTDTIYGGNGTDSIYAGAQADIVYGDAGNDRIYGEGGNDTIVGGSGADTVEGGSGNDIFFYGAVGDSSAAAGKDRIADFVKGADKIDLSSLGFLNIGELSITTGGGITEISNSQTGFAITLTGNYMLTSSDFIFASGIPTITGTTGNDTLTGTVNSEILEGLAGNDTLNAGSANDTLIGGLGADVLKGEAGADVYRISDKSHSTASSMDTILGFSTTGGDKIDLSGLNFSDIHNGQINAEGTTLAYWFQFGDTFVGNADGSFRLRIDGEFNLTRSDFVGVGPDYAFTHIGTTGNDSLVGGSSVDTFNGGKGQDVMRGHAGSDIYFFDHLEDSKKTSPDTILNWDNSDVIDVSYLGFTGIQANTANGSTLGWKVSGSYTEIFDSGKFLIRISNTTTVGGVTPNPTAANFIFSEGPGFNDESYTGTNGSDDYTAGLGNDVLYGNYGDDSLIGGGGHDTIDGGEGNDTLVGGDGDDTLFGQGGYDRLEAGNGHDRLIAGTNKDWLVGGSGNDAFLFFSASHSSEMQPDTIADFVKGEDVIDLSTLTFTGVQSGAASSTVLGFTYQQNSSTQNITVIEANDGSFELILMGHINLANGDFLF